MPETVERCPLCGHQKSALFDQRQFRGHLVTNRVCAHCGLVYQSPRMTTGEQDKFYEEEYRRLYQGDEGPAPRDLSIQAGRAEALLHFVRNRISPPLRHLDIGSSSGLLLRRFQGHYHGVAIGVEPGIAYRAYARARGLTIYRSLEELGEAGVDPFDLISMAHVLEHLPQPVAYLADLRRHFLAPTGWLLVEVPNLYAHNCFEVAHLVSFSAHTLRQTLRAAGYEVLHSYLHGEPRSVVLPLYLTALARPVGASPATNSFEIRSERAVVFKRRAGMLRRRVLQRLFPDLAWL